MKSYFGYVRVSTVKQGEQGSSLQEQRAAIESYARRNELMIAGWFEEMETAAKQGRRAFTKMLQELGRKKAAGVIIHKIDRSARNLKDWAHLGELIDRGVEVHFVHDNLDLSTRGGRLSADIQAVVAADFIRNLREEVRKGQRGRLRQGLYPFGAPRGYLNQGKGKVKAVDPVVGPLVTQAFELYGSGKYGLHELRFELAQRGLSGPGGRPLALDSISRLLHNPFYMGLIRLRASGETYEGVHTPLVSKALFERVQAMLSGRLYPRSQVHRFLFRRLIKCGACGRSLTGERQRGHVYYRCHSYACRGVSVSERAVDETVRKALFHLRVDERDVGEIRETLAEGIAADHANEAKRQQERERDLALVEQRLERLTDALLDGVVDKDDYEARRASLLAKRIELRGATAENSTNWEWMAKRFEFGLTAWEAYKNGLDEEKRDIVAAVGSNIIARGKTLEFPLFSPFAEFRKHSIDVACAHHRGAVRTAIRDKKRNLTRGDARRLILRLGHASTTPRQKRKGV